jgi:hypothetical protein
VEERVQGSTNGLRDQMATMQRLLRKHNVLAEDIKDIKDIKDQCDNVYEADPKLGYERNLPAMQGKQHRDKTFSAGKLVNVQKACLPCLSVFFQFGFMWKGNFAHSRIANKSLSVDFCQDLSSVRALLAKKETLEASLRTFEPEDIKNIPALKEQLNIGHQHIVSINLKINVMIKGWNSAEKKQFLIQVENQFQQIEWFSLTGLKKSFAFTSWFDDAEDSQPRVQKLRGEDVQLGGGLVSAPTNFNTDFELLSSGANLRGQQWRPLQSSVETRGPSVEPALLLRDKPCELRGALPIRLSSICTFLGLPKVLPRKSGCWC